MNSEVSAVYCIRAAVPRDVDAMVRMTLALQDHLATGTPTLWGMSDKRVAELPLHYHERIADQAAQVLVVEHQPSHTLVGMAIAAIHYHEDYRPEQSGAIDDVWIDQEHRGRGLCRALLRRLVEFFKEQGITDLLLRYADGNKEAETVWKHYGFRPTLITATARLGDVEDVLVRHRRKGVDTR